MTAVLRVLDLDKSFLKGDKRVVALQGLNLDVEEGTFLTVLGRSGCGKSTLLNMLAGLTQPTSGRIEYRGRPVTGPHHDLAYLTQHDTLMPWRDLQRNIEMPLEVRGVSKTERTRVAGELIQRVGLSGFEKHYPRELSGGMRRRAGLARMLSAAPETFLLDEPFGALDAQLRAELQSDLLRLWRGSGKTVVFITHDLEEALLLGDRVIVLGQLGRVLLDQPIGLPRPRDLDQLRVDPDFVALHRRTAEALRAGSPGTDLRKEGAA
ncbi:MULTISPECIES: ABC transporter ATP-binding protein [unclassified Kribbella]|uniref:ABC transporter ATP-binding protein n=1 Tax=unclassified Kribbella TaxID=2644121 RepID=UPI00378E1DC1|nr:ABC transporter ATP-binding protein [Kribbella sp. NBC_00889]